MRRRITQEQAIELADWMHSKKEWIERTGAESPDVVALAKKELGIITTPSAVLRIAKVKGIHFKRSLAATNRESRLMILARCVGDLYDRLGEESPEELALLLSQDDDDE